MLEKFNRRITVKAFVSSEIDEYGSVTKTEVSSWGMWANVEQRSGSSSTSNGQEVWNYDTKITVRYEQSRPIKSNMFVLYEGTKYKINNVAVQKERFKEFVTLRCSKTDEYIN